MQRLFDVDYTSFIYVDKATSIRFAFQPSFDVVYTSVRDIVST